MANETVLREAAFRERVVDYWLVSGTVTLACTLIGLPLAPVWYFLGRPLCLKYLARISCTLTTRNLIIRKGWLNRIEKTIPLDKITDLAMFQGPIMRAMDLKGFKVETAGSGGANTGYLVALVGIQDPDEFRDAVLEQRDARDDARHGGARTESFDTTESSAEPGPAAGRDAVLVEIRDALLRIETTLARGDAS